MPDREDNAEVQPPPGQPARHASYLLLAVLSCFFVGILTFLRFPAASLLGALCAAILLAVRGAAMKMPFIAFRIGQAIIGLLIGLGMPRGFVSELGRSWPLFLGGVFWAVIASTILGLLLTRWRIFPGTTAIWGLSPGAASAMVVMSEEYGGDIRLVAFMQYLRVLSVVLVTSIVARVWVGDLVRPAGPDWFVLPEFPGFFHTVLALAVSLLVAGVTRIPSGSLLVAIVVGVVCNYSGLVLLDRPPWLMSCGSVLLGWSIGLRFNRNIVLQAARSFRRVFLSILILIGICGVYAAGMVVFAGIDPLTAYLAASPGGLDSVAIIAASTHVDLSFVMAMQTARFVVVLATGPFLARHLVRKGGFGIPPREEPLQ